MNAIIMSNSVMYGTGHSKRDKFMKFVKSFTKKKKKDPEKSFDEMKSKGFPVEDV